MYNIFFPTLAGTGGLGQEVTRSNFFIGLASKNAPDTTAIQVSISHVSIHVQELKQCSLSFLPYYFNVFTVLK